MATTARSLWAGRIVALLAVLLLAANLRTSVAVLSPIVSMVRGDIPLDAVAFGVLGTLPPLAFAISGVVAPLVARRLGLETTMVIACLAMVAGPLVRAAAPNYAVLLVGSALAFAGMGFGNILVPPAVKKYFPDRIAQVTAAYGTIMAIGASVPPLIATPVALSAGWRVSVGCWAVFAIAALVPWIVLRAQAGVVAAREREQDLVPEPKTRLIGNMVHSRTAVAIAIAFSVTSLNVYAFLAWLPELLIDRSGSTPVEAGALLSLFAFTGLPLALIAPLLASRVNNVGYLMALGGGLFFVGYLGLLVVPALAPWLWVLLAGLGAIVFPLCLALIGLRTRGPDGAVALSGFAQAIGYASGALGPLVFGILHDATGGWEAPLVFLLATSLVAIVPAVLLRRRSFVEDEIEAKANRGKG